MRYYFYFRATTGLFVAAILLTSQAVAMSPVPFFRYVEYVGLLCALDRMESPVPDAANGVAPTAGLLSEEVLCRRAAAVLSGLLPSVPVVAPFAINDSRIADTAALLVLLHVTMRLENGQAFVAMAATLHRAGSDVGAPPFFMMPPQALTSAGSFDEAALDAALLRLLDPLAKALNANR